jgi:hypothetical protein
MVPLTVFLRAAKRLSSVSKHNCNMDTNEELPLPAEHHEPAGPVCAGCEGPLYEQKGRTPICNECRERFIRYPIPGWIKIFGGAILLLMVFGLTRLPANLSAAIHQKRGERAMAEHRYATAQRANLYRREPAPAHCRLLQ